MSPATPCFLVARLQPRVPAHPELVLSSQPCPSHSCGLRSIPRLRPKHLGNCKNLLVRQIHDPFVLVPRPLCRPLRGLAHFLPVHRPRWLFESPLKPHLLVGKQTSRISD